ncbi:hypothetical protein N752_21990 [Desulforamulus aquiferis]|nr:hypothetical protein [Desulforamulus aquiferis]RYD03085.1 hypothetical protein N752_21990 [Desulforamulus aquiferis]
MSKVAGIATGYSTPGAKTKKLFTFKNVLITLLCSLVLAGTGLGGYIYFIGTDKADARTGPDPEKLISLNMGSLLVNLADPGGSNFMRLTPVLEYEKNKVNKKLPEELNRKKSRSSGLHHPHY